MQHYKLQKIKAPALDALQCDCCGRRTPTAEIEELQEYLRIDFQAGYGSRVFPDEAQCHCIIRKNQTQDQIMRQLSEILIVATGFMPGVETDRLFKQLNRGINPLTTKKNIPLNGLRPTNCNYAMALG